MEVGEVVVDVVSDVVVDLVLQDANSITATSSVLKPNQMTFFFTIYLSFKHNDFAAILTVMFTPVNYVLMLYDFVTILLLNEKYRHGMIEVLDKFEKQLITGRRWKFQYIR